MRKTAEDSCYHRVKASSESFSPPSSARKEWFCSSYFSFIQTRRRPKIISVPTSKSPARIPPAQSLQIFVLGGLTLAVILINSGSVVGDGSSPSPEPPEPPCRVLFDHCKARPHLVGISLDELEKMWVGVRCARGDEDPVQDKDRGNVGSSESASALSRPADAPRLRLFRTNTLTMREQPKQSRNERLALEVWRLCENSHLEPVVVEDLRAGAVPRSGSFSAAQWPRRSDVHQLGGLFETWMQFGNTPFEFNAGVSVDYRMSFHWGQYELQQFSDYELGVTCDFDNGVDWNALLRFMLVRDRAWQCEQLTTRAVDWNLMLMLGGGRSLGWGTLAGQ